MKTPKRIMRVNGQAAPWNTPKLNELIPTFSNNLL